MGRGGGQRASPASRDSLGRQPALPAGLIGVRCPPQRGMGGGGGAGGGRGGAPATVLVTPGARRSRSAAAAAPPAVPPTPHGSVGPRATVRTCPRPRGGPSAIAWP